MPSRAYKPGHVNLRASRMGRQHGDKETRLQGLSLKPQKRLILKVGLLSVYATFYVRGETFSVYSDFTKKKRVGKLLFLHLQ